jgi:hypothetical protein
VDVQNANPRLDFKALFARPRMATPVHSGPVLSTLTCNSQGSLRHVNEACPETHQAFLSYFRDITDDQRRRIAMLTIVGSLHHGNIRGTHEYREQVVFSDRSVPNSEGYVD